MKTASILLTVLFLIFLISCGSETGDTGNTGDSGNLGDLDDVGDSGDIDEKDDSDIKIETDLDDNSQDDEDTVDDSDSGDIGDDHDTGNTSGPCDSDPCFNKDSSTGQCIKLGDSYKCVCVPDYSWESDIEECVICPGVEFGGGTGSEKEPYKIKNIEHLNNIRNCIGANFIQTENIDLKDYLSKGGAGYNDGKGWVTIGSPSGFLGNYNGNGHTIKNLYINDPSMGAGLFSEVRSVVKNLGLIDVNLTTEISAGSISGSVGIGSKIQNCYSTGIIKGSRAGGIVATLGEKALIENCYSEADVTGIEDVGGIVGFAFKSSIINCHSHGKVNGEKNVGGLVGYTLYESVIKNSYSTSDVDGIEAVGGLTGISASSEIIDCYSSGIVKGTKYVGGLSGYIIKDTVENCYSSGSVTGEISTGGMIGDDDNIGGDVSTITESFWDIENSGQTLSDGGTGKNTAEMKTESTFIDWDFNTIWDMDSSINDGYPFLR